MTWLVAFPGLVDLEVYLYLGSVYYVGERLEMNDE